MKAIIHIQSATDYYDALDHDHITTKDEKRMHVLAKNVNDIATTTHGGVYIGFKEETYFIESARITRAYEQSTDTWEL